MPRYMVLIGTRELEIQAADAQSAVDTAMKEYPGEVVSGYGFLGDDEPSDQSGPSPLPESDSE